MLNIEHLTKTYGGKAAVQDLSLHIRPGEICAFIGHNGAGKTTTLKCCCGIQQFRGRSSSTAAALRWTASRCRMTRWNASGGWPICRTTRTCTNT